MTAPTTIYKSRLYQMTQTTPTCLWNDSASLQELAYSIEHGGVGATCNPVIVVEVLKKEMHLWRDRITDLVRDLPTASEDAIAWTLVEEMSQRAAELLMPVFEREGGRNGRLSVQTDPRLYRDAAAIVEQAVRFSHLAPNIIVKIPVVSAGIAAIEEATYRGVNINATVSFSVPQAIAVAEAFERGLRRREREGLDVSSFGSVCTIMVGRLDDWLKLVADKRDISVDPGAFEWAGVAAFKKAYALYKERGYRLRLLSAAFRNHMHWSEFIGGDVVISPPHKWQVRFNASDVEVERRIDVPVAPAIMSALMKFDDFRRAYDEHGMTVEEFDTFGPTRRTLRQFVAACYDLNAQIREFMIPNPDDLKTPK
ncbi:MAG: transaldolase family protein [Acidobacteria bacterium]|nr:transaldolase family protein [Acidobacteriota bacterium]